MAGIPCRSGGPRTVVLPLRRLPALVATPLSRPAGMGVPA